MLIKILISELKKKKNNKNSNNKYIPTSHEIMEK